MKEIGYYIRNSKEKHNEFRHSYAVGQLNTTMIISGIGIMHGLLGATVYGKYLLNTERYIRNVFVTLMMLGITTLVLSIYGRHKYKSGEIPERSPFIEILSMNYAVGYLVWCFMLMYYSIREGSPTSYLAVAVAYTFCTGLLYFAPQHYVVLFGICMGVSYYMLSTMKPGGYDVNTYIDVVILGIILTVAGISKYYAGKHEHEALRSERVMREEMEHANEELVTYNRQLKELTDKLKASESTQKKFTASMNHELRSPLNGIIGLLQILRDDEELNEQQYDYVSRALQSSETLIQIVNDILDFAKMDAGEFTVVNEPFDLRKVIENVSDITCSQAEAKSLKYKISVSSDTPCTLMGDGTHLQQVIVNLVTNGIKYTEKGSVRLSVGVKDDQQICVTVADTGRGIPKEAREYLFMPYKRFGENDKAYIQGTGLGLAIVAELVKKMKGVIDVESEVGRGSIFKVVIPTQVLDPVEYYGQPRKEEEQQAETPDYSGLRILCVDDTPVNLTVFKGLLNKTGAIIGLAAGGLEAIKCLESTQYDIVFLDHMMPDADGIEVLRDLRSKEGINREIPVIALTANAGADAELKYRDVGFNGYMAKPVLREDLYNTINEYFSDRNKED